MLAEGQEGEAARLMDRLHEAYGSHMAVELHRHGQAAERAVEPGMIAMADRMGLPLVATNECFPETGYVRGA